MQKRHDKGCRDGSVVIKDKHWIPIPSYGSSQLSVPTISGNSKTSSGQWAQGMYTVHKYSSKTKTTYKGKIKIFF